MQQHHRVIAGVDDPRVRRDGLRHLVGVAGRRQPGTHAQELADTAVGVSSPGASCPGMGPILALLTSRP